MNENNPYDPNKISSQYEFEEEPQFKSKIPTYLTKNLEAKELYIVQTVSELEQRVAWNSKQIQEAGKAVIDLDKFRIWSLQQYNRFMSKWTVVWLIIIWTSSLFSKHIVDAISKLFGGK